MAKNSNKIITFILGTVGVAYVAGAVFFSSNTFPNTKVNGKESGLISFNKVFNSKIDSGKLKVIGRNDANLDLSLSDLEIKKAVVKEPEIKQNNFMWPIEIFKKHEHKINFDVNYNKEKLSKIVKESEFMKDQIKPVDAKIEYNQDKDKYVIIPEVMGTTIEQNKIESAIIDTVISSEDTVKLDSYYTKPKITVDDDSLKKQLKEIDTITSHEYIFDFEDREYILKGKKIFDMYTTSDKGYKLDKDILRDYVADIARETDTYASTRTFEATDIGEIKVGPGIYGWQMDVDKTRDNLLAMMQKKQDGKVEIAYRADKYFSYTGMSRKKNDIGNTYIEVDLSRQTLWYYEEGNLIVKTPIVSGQANIKYAATPTGVNKIRDKQSPKMLKGVDEIRGGSYEVPVNYWMNVGWTGSGIHDVGYRDRFGGDIYKYNGSSSCMNTPKKAMKKLYERVKLGTPVVIYESSTNYSPNEFKKQEMNSKRELAKKKQSTNSNFEKNKKRVSIPKKVADPKKITTPKKVSTPKRSNTSN